MQPLWPCVENNEDSMSTQPWTSCFQSPPLTGPFRGGVHSGHRRNSQREGNMNHSYPEGTHKGENGDVFIVKGLFTVIASGMLITGVVVVSGSLQWKTPDRWLHLLWLIVWLRGFMKLHRVRWQGSKPKVMLICGGATCIWSKTLHLTGLCLLAK